MTASAYSASASADDRVTLAEINITPLVDVMLVLLVIFMISAPAVTGTLSMRLPAASPTAVEAPRLTLQVDPGGGFVLDGRSIAAAALRPALADVAVRTPRAVLEIAASGDADYQAFATALAAARASGLENITFAR